jgi:hypothetical protein
MNVPKVNQNAPGRIPWNGNAFPAVVAKEMLYKNAGWMANRPNQINQVPKPQYTDRLA